ncbi:hypothetical protein SELMODRAFT_424841 [Selaginella moellendorffii]|uniref:Uncharacterized protein n=1 Tax=Selaginella moellendorffii TaxID=88036 RepID=D8SR67_SELML|nr:hypothetical protein SELMODRAFT_424841 [Selaginella moellendorffii]
MRTCLLGPKLAGEKIWADGPSHPLGHVAPIRRRPLVVASWPSGCENSRENAGGSGTTSTNYSIVTQTPNRPKIEASSQPDDPTEEEIEQLKDAVLYKDSTVTGQEIGVLEFGTHEQIVKCLVMVQTISEVSKQKQVDKFEPVSMDFEACMEAFERPLCEAFFTVGNAFNEQCGHELHAALFRGFSQLTRAGGEI